MVRSISVIAFLIFSLTSWSQSNQYTLAQCIEVGLKNNISLNQNGLDVERNEVRLTQSKASLLPTLNASASHGYNWGQTIDPFTNQFATNRIQSNSFGIGTGITLFNGFTLQNTIKQSDLNLKIAELGLEANRNAIALAIANAYLGVLFNQELNAANQANLEASQEQLARVQLLVEAGQVPEADLFQVQAQVAQDESRVISSENSIAISTLNLMQLIQLPEDRRAGFSIASPTSDVPEFLLPEKQSVINYAITNFPEVKSAELGIANAEIGYRIAQGGRLPRLGASFNYGSGFSGARQVPIGEPTFETVTIGTVEGSGDEVLTLSPSFSDFETVPFFDQLETNVNRSLFFSLNIPIFNGLSNNTNVQLAQINKKNAELNVLNVKNDLQQTVESAYADASAAFKTYQAADLSLKAQDEAFKYAKIRFEEQAINGVDFAQARSLRDAALAEKIRSRYDYIFRLKILEFYQGKTISLN